MLYKEIGSTLKNNFQGWHAWIIGYQDEQMKEIGLKPSVKIPLNNGKLECSLREYVMFDGSYSDFRADGGSVSSKVSEKMKSEGPRKVRHISDDDWKKESKKFNRDNSFKQKGKRKEDLGKKGRRDEEWHDKKKWADKDFNRFKDDEIIERANRNHREEENRPWERKNRENGNKFSDKNFRDNRSGKEKRYKDNDRKGGDRKFHDKDRDFRSGREKRDREKGPSFTYNPANSRGPRLPESSEQVINAVHLRKRKNKAASELEED